MRRPHWEDPIPSDPNSKGSASNHGGPQIEACGRSSLRNQIAEFHGRLRLFRPSGCSKRAATTPCGPLRSCLVRSLGPLGSLLFTVAGSGDRKTPTRAVDCPPHGPRHRFLSDAPREASRVASSRGTCRSSFPRFLVLVRRCPKGLGVVAGGPKHLGGRGGRPTLGGTEAARGAGAGGLQRCGGEGCQSHESHEGGKTTVTLE